MPENNGAPVEAPQFRLSVPVAVSPVKVGGVTHGTYRAELCCHCQGLECEPIQGEGRTEEEAVDSLIKQVNEYCEPCWEVRRI